mmetsp:Transcript_102219/g.305140  ORF Transcript_102219/g.305140 Transcript_102219/m.305140 type:complete len:339 (-) Transcript_102219:229-1245(-)
MKKRKPGGARYTAATLTLLYVESKAPQRAMTRASTSTSSALRRRSSASSLCEGRPPAERSAEWVATSSPEQRRSVARALFRGGSSVQRKTPRLPRPAQNARICAARDSRGIWLALHCSSLSVRRMWTASQSPSGTSPNVSLRTRSALRMWHWRTLTHRPRALRPASAAAASSRPPRISLKPLCPSSAPRNSPNLRNQGGPKRTTTDRRSARSAASTSSASPAVSAGDGSSPLPKPGGCSKKAFQRLGQPAGCPPWNRMRLSVQSIKKCRGACPFAASASSQPKAQKSREKRPSVQISHRQMETATGWPPGTWPPPLLPQPRAPLGPLPPSCSSKTRAA